MSQVRKCYNENCENNYMGAYCECCEITIDENGCCCSYFPKQEEQEDEESGERMARYKDIDAIIEQMNGSTAETWGKGLGRSWWSHSVMLKDNIVQLMKDAPEADVVEVRHGKWLLDGRCSECLENPLTTHRTYCPSCGAKMDKNELLENPEQLDLRPISCGDENGGEVTE